MLGRRRWQGQVRAAAGYPQLGPGVRKRVQGALLKRKQRLTVAQHPPPLAWLPPTFAVVPAADQLGTYRDQKARWARKPRSGPQAPKPPSPGPGPDPHVARGFAIPDSRPPSLPSAEPARGSPRHRGARDGGRGPGSLLSPSPARNCRPAHSRIQPPGSQFLGWGERLWFTQSRGSESRRRRRPTVRVAPSSRAKGSSPGTELVGRLGRAFLALGWSQHRLGPSARSSAPPLPGRTPG